MAVITTQGVRYYNLSKLYLCRNVAFSSSGKWLKYAFQPGQKLICHLQKRPIRDLGFSSYFFLKVQFEHLYSSIV